MGISVRQLRVWGEKIRRVWLLSGRTNLGLIAAGVAFYASFSIFPGMAAIIAIFGLAADPGVVRSELSLLREVIPADAYLLLEDQMNSLLSAGRQTLGWTTVLSLALALWAARAGVSAMVAGLNAIYDLPNRYGLWHEIFSLILTLVLVAMAILALVIVFVAPILIAFLPLDGNTVGLVTVLRWATALILMLGGLVLIYRIGPNRRLRRAVAMVWGAMAVVVLWLLASALLSFYMSQFPNYNRVYGSIGAVVALLFWVWISAYLVLMGAALNAVREGLDRVTKPAINPR